MTGSIITPSAPAIPPDVLEFADTKEIGEYLNEVIGISREAFPSSTLHVSLGQDAEDETHEYVAFDVEVGAQTTEELLAGQQVWSAGVTRVCPSRLAIYFVLGWR